MLQQDVSRLGRDRFQYKLLKDMVCLWEIIFAPNDRTTYVSTYDASS